MARTQHKRAKAKEKQTPVIQWAVIVVVAALVVVILILKAQSSPPSADSVGAIHTTLPAAETTGAAQPTATPLPEVQLDQLLAAGEPAFVFFHSNDCYQCIRMIEIVEQVYPDFAGSVPLIDVNVYDERNSNLLRRAGLRYIPMLVFVDRAGQGESHVGVMEAEALRAQLQRLAGE